MSPLVSTFAGAALRPYGFTLGGAAPAAFELISTQVLTSTVASVTFSSISASTYKHLQLRIVGRQNSSYSYPTGQMIFNSDSGSNYAWHRLQGAGGSVGSAGVGSYGNINFGMFEDAASATNSFGPAIVDILDAFSTTKYKTTRALSGIASTSQVIEYKSGLWLSTSAISSITITGDGSWVSGSRFSLYGVKGS